MSEAIVPFEKWEGLGNDFILMETVMTAEMAQRLCDRRRGIGADGVLIVDREQARMQVWNADGSRPEMCGNGLRCVAAYLVATNGQRGGSDGLSIATDDGVKKCRVVSRDKQGEYEVLVEMGCAQIQGDFVVEASRKAHRFVHVDVGNPHAVTFEPYDEETIDRVGPLVSAAPEAGINVEFCRRIEGKPRHIEVTVWERGVGRTLACGTGACAVAAAACAKGDASYGVPMSIGLPGGVLEVTVAADTKALLMRGPARRVFTGEVVIR